MVIGCIASSQNPSTLILRKNKEHLSLPGPSRSPKARAPRLTASRSPIARQRINLIEKHLHHHLRYVLQQKTNKGMETKKIFILLWETKIWLKSKPVVLNMTNFSGSIGAPLWIAIPPAPGGRHPRPSQNAWKVWSNGPQPGRDSKIKVRGNQCDI